MLTKRNTDYKYNHEQDAVYHVLLQHEITPADTQAMIDDTSQWLKEDPDATGQWPTLLW